MGFIMRAPPSRPTPGQPAAVVVGPHHTQRDPRRVLRSMQTDTAVAIPRELDAAACLVCEAPLSGAPQPINDGWSMVVCRVCDAGITTPIPSADDLVEYNAGFY